MASLLWLVINQIPTTNESSSSLSIPVRVALIIGNLNRKADNEII